LLRLERLFPLKWQRLWSPHTNASCAAIDGEALEGDALRIFDVHYGLVPLGSVGDRGAWICNQGEPVKALNYDVLLAHAGDADRVWLGGIEMGENARKWSGYLADRRK